MRRPLNELVLLEAPHQPRPRDEMHPVWRGEGIVHAIVSCVLQAVLFILSEAVSSNRASRAVLLQ
jgi:hypothetical protein